MKNLAFSPALLAALLAPAWAQVPPPAEQRRFVEIVVQAQQEFRRADNAMQKGGAKQRRESALCKLLPEREVTGYAPGTNVSFEFGRANRTKLTGVVIAFAPKNDKVPATYAIQTGTGLDTKVVKVPAVAVTLIEEQGA